MRIFSIPDTSLSFGPAPRSAQDLDELGGAGIQVVVTLLTGDEIREIFPELASQWQSRGGTWMHYPIEDRGLPRGDFAAFLGQISSESPVFVHCRAGIGRSSLAVGALLALRQRGTRAIWERIEEARGCPVPDTEEQRDWLLNFRPGRPGPNLDEILEKLE